MTFGHTHCPVVEGWQGRIATKLTVAGVLGAAAGSTLSILQNKAFVHHSLGTALSCMICMGGFAACQEVSRLLRCEDSAANSIMAGAATGAALMGLQRGKAATLPAAFVCGAAAGTLHVVDDTMQPLSAFRQYLMTYGLLDKDVQQTVETEAHPKHHQNAPSQQSVQSVRPSDPTWTERLGIRHLNDQEWAQHEQEKREQMRKRLAKAGLGPEDRMVKRPQP